MERETKIKVLEEIRRGNKKPLDIINGGVFLWQVKDGMCRCESLGFEGWVIPFEIMLRLSETSGGLHLWEERTCG